MRIIHQGIDGEVTVGQIAGQGGQEKCRSQAGKSHHDIFGIILMDFEKFLIVHHQRNQFLNIVGFIGVDRHDLIEFVFQPVIGVIRM